MDKRLSNKISGISFIAAIMVVYRHSLNYAAFFPDGSPALWNKFLQGTVMNLTEVAVPFFFIVSGFFFMKPVPYMKMVRKKAQTLLLPFIVWNTVGLVVLLSTPVSKNGLVLEDVSLADFCLSEYYGPLWYVRDLMLLMLLSPVYKWMFHSRVLTLALLCVVFWHWFPVDGSVLSSEGLFFFMLGYCLNHLKLPIERNMPLWCVSIVSMAWTGMSVYGHLWDNVWFHKLNTLLGIVAVWGIYDYVTVRWKWQWLCPYSFMIYVTHFYVIKVMKLSIASVALGNDMASVVCFFLLPVVTVAVAICFAVLLQHICPKVYNIITGGR